MSYTSNLTKIKPAPLSLEKLPKYIKFVKKHGETSFQYIERMSKEEISALIKADVKNFLSKEKAMASRQKSQKLKSEKINPEQDMKDVTYFNTDLQKYITAKVPSNINIIKKKDRLPISFDFDIPEFDYSDLYDITPTSGGYIKKRVSKKRSVKLRSAKKSGGAKRRVSKKRSMKKRSVKRISKKHSSGAKKRSFDFDIPEFDFVDLYNIDLTNG